MENIKNKHNINNIMEETLVTITSHSCSMIEKNNNKVLCNVTSGEID